jgi:anti-sigma B factor antagonist
VHVSVIGNPDGSVVVAVRGDLDVDSATVLTTTLDQVLDRPAPRVVVDLSGVDFCDSTGLSAFVVGHKRAAAAGGWLRLAAPGGWMSGLLDTVGLTGRLGIYPSVADALASAPPT